MLARHSPLIEPRRRRRKVIRRRRGLTRGEERGKEVEESEEDEDKERHELDVEGWRRGIRVALLLLASALLGVDARRVEATVSKREGWVPRLVSGRVLRGEQDWLGLTLGIPEPSTAKEGVEKVLRVDFLALEPAVESSCSSTMPHTGEIGHAASATARIGVGAVAVEDSALVRVGEDLEGLGDDWDTSRGNQAMSWGGRRVD